MSKKEENKRPEAGMTMLDENTVQVTLGNPLRRGDNDIYHIVVKKPLARNLKKINLSDLLQQNVDAVAIVLSRITEPQIIDSEFSAMELSDIALLSSAVTLFFTSAGMRSEMAATVSSAFSS